MALPYTMPPVSPFDVITSQAENEKIANIEALADGTGIDNKAVTIAKINGGSTAGVLTTDASGNVSATGNYSTSEVNTNTTWIDGKVIYKKTVLCTGLPNKTTKNFAHGVTKMDRMINVYGWTFSTNTGVMDALPIPAVRTTSGSLGLEIGIFVNTTNITIETGQDRSALSAYVTIEYTKKI